MLFGAMQLHSGLHQLGPLTKKRKAEIQQSATTALRAAACSMPAPFASEALQVMAATTERYMQSINVSTAQRTSHMQPAEQHSSKHANS